MNNIRTRKYSAEQAIAILDKHCFELNGKQASTSTIIEKPQTEYVSKAAWLTNPKPANPAALPRHKAYIRAYMEIAGDNFYGAGIPLSDCKYLRADKAVMKNMLVHEMVELNAGSFCLTDKGHDFIKS